MTALVALVGCRFIMPRSQIGRTRYELHMPPLRWCLYCVSDLIPKPVLQVHNVIVLWVVHSVCSQRFLLLTHNRPYSVSLDNSVLRHPTAQTHHPSQQLRLSIVRLSGRPTSYYNNLTLKTNRTVRVSHDLQTWTKRVLRSPASSQERNQSYFPPFRTG